MRSILIPVLLMLGACSSAPTTNEIDSADFGLDVSEEACLAVAQPFIREQMGDPESTVFQNLKCYRGWEGNVPAVGVKATYGHRFAGEVDSKGAIRRYTGFTPFSGIVRDDGEGPRVVRYCITSATDDYRFCIPSMVEE